MTITLGFSFMLEAPRATPELAAAMVALATSPGWPKALRYFQPLPMSGSKPVRRPGMVNAKVLPEVLTSVILDESTRIAAISTSLRNDAEFAQCCFDTQTMPWHSRLHAIGDRPSTGDASATSWLEALLAFVTTTRVTMGVVVATPSFDDIRREQSVLSGTSPGPPEHPTYPEWHRLARNRDHVGDRYVRFPRWGTIYSHAHVAALGGVGAITDAVQPALIRELSAGVYVQLTDALSSALAPAARAKQAAFTTLVAPLLPPPVE